LASPKKEQTMASNKETVIMLHGALGSAEQMKPLGKSLTKNFEVHYLTYQGHDGKNPGLFNFSIEFFSNDVVNYMRENHIRKASFVGYSMGGYVALFLARYQPELVNRVVALATKLEWNPQLAATEMCRLDPEVIQEKWPQFAKDLQKLHGSKNWTVVLKNTADMMQRMGQHPPLTHHDFSRLSQISLLATGDQDDAATPEEIQKYGRMMPKGRYHIFPNTPHPLQKMNMKMVSAEITKFLETPSYEFTPQSYADFFISKEK
jgi:pimeloyl-ACP methyl ester carboxylesterase